MAAASGNRLKVSARNGPSTRAAFSWSGENYSEIITSADAYRSPFAGNDASLLPPGT